MTTVSFSTRSMGSFSTAGTAVTGAPRLGHSQSRHWQSRRTQSRRAQSGRVQSSRSTLRLTRRGRAVLLALVTVPLAIVALVVTLNGGGATATDHAGTVHYVTVQAGESLWQVATEIAPSADPREVVAELGDLNGLGSDQVQPGQRLAIPSQYDH